MILQIGQKVRLALEKFANTQADTDNKLTGLCGIGSILLSLNLSEKKIGHKILYSGCHAFIYLDNGTILDTTATQFDIEEEILIADHNEWLEYEDPNFGLFPYDVLPECQSKYLEDPGVKTINELIQFTESWPFSFSRYIRAIGIL